MSNEFKINDNIEFDSEYTKRKFQKYLDEINEYNRKVANGEKPEVDLSEMMNKFKEKFDVEGVKTSPVEDNKLDELIEEIKKNLGNGYTNKELTIDERVESIDRGIEELNSQESNTNDNVFVDYTNMNSIDIKKVINNQSKLLKDKLADNVNSLEKDSTGLLFWNCKMILRNILMASNKLITKYRDDLTEEEYNIYNQVKITIENDENQWDNLELVRLTYSKINVLFSSSLNNNEEILVSFKCPKCGNIIKENCANVPNNIMKLDTMCSRCGTNIMFKNPNYRD